MQEEQLSGAESVVQIDELNLDKECIRLPSDYLKYAHLSAEAKRDVDEHKSNVDVVQADLAQEIRTAPGDFGIEKITEAAITAKILTMPRYQKALARLQKARYQSDLAQAVVWALEHKKRSLTLLVDLHGMGYFSDVKLSKEGKESVEEMTRKRVRRPRDEE